MLPGPVILLAGRLATPLTIGYIASAAWYIYQIVHTLDIRTAPHPPDFLAPGHRAGDLFALVGTVQWLVFGINRRTSGAATAASLVLAGLHVLLFAIRTYIVPLRWILEQTAR